MGGKKLLVILIILTIPAFFRMLRPGIYSMHDFHAFRLYEFDQCMKDGQIPCRWSANSTLEYGQPLFNYYSQIVYIPAEIMHLAGFSNLTSLKFSYILTLVLSALTMYFLASYLWKSKMAGLLSGVLYVYAPYRAVDVWVRGALPEASAFIFFPLIIYLFEKKKYLFLSLALASLLLIHNLSFLMFMVFFIPWVLFRLKEHKIFKLVLTGFLTLGVSSFYLLPIIFEGKLVGLGGITTSYYDYKLHYTTLRQLFISRFWGYGGSTWGPNDTMSFSVGHIHWAVGIYVTALAYIKKNYKLLLVLGVGWFALFLTHGKSEIFWENVPGLSYLQFSWRFLSLAAFLLALGGGYLAKDYKKISIIVVALAIVFNINFFKEDIWQNVADKEYFSGELWEWQTSSARGDFWPAHASEVPETLAPKFPGLIKTSNSASVSVTLEEESEIVLPIVYFDGWQGNVDIYPSGEYGLITFALPAGDHNIELEFKNTPVRSVGNWLSVLSLVVFGILWRKHEK